MAGEMSVPYGHKYIYAEIQIILKKVVYKAFLR